MRYDKNQLRYDDFCYTFFDYIYFIGEFKNMRMTGPVLLSTPCIPVLIFFCHEVIGNGTFHLLLLPLLFFFGVCFLVGRFYRRHNRRMAVRHHFITSPWSKSYIAIPIALLWYLLSMILPLIILGKWGGFLL